MLAMNLSRKMNGLIYMSISEVTFISTPNKKWIEVVTAGVVLKDNAEPDEKVFISFPNEKLAPFTVPKGVFFVDELAKNSLCKVLKRELRDSLK